MTDTETAVGPDEDDVYRGDGETDYSEKPKKYAACQHRWYMIDITLFKCEICGDTT